MTDERTLRWPWIVTLLFGLPVLVMSYHRAHAVEQEFSRNSDATLRLKKPEVTTNSIGIKLVLVPPGEFVMGSTPAQLEAAGEASPGLAGVTGEPEQPAHRVRITRPFYLGETEVTRGQFRQFVNDTGYQTEAETDKFGGQGWNTAIRAADGNKREYNWRATGFDQTDDHPVVNVTSNDATKFCEWLSKKEGGSYRLPAEAQWEYACRAGSTTAFQCGDDAEVLSRYANIADKTADRFFGYWEHVTTLSGVKFIKARDAFVFTAPVRQFEPNAFGLYDMHGNVAEWCSDYYDAAYYRESPPDDPEGPGEGKTRVLRGGGWLSSAWLCRSAVRIQAHPAYRSAGVGFRVVRDAQAK